MKKKTKKGFSLLELLIVVAIILIIATIAIPSLLRSRQATNESAAVGDLRTLNTAEVTYASSNAQNYATLAELTTQNLIDNRFTLNGNKLHGYIWSEGEDITVGSDTVGGPAPTLYGFLGTHDGTSARYDYKSGTDAVVRYGANFPSGRATGEPVQ